MAITHAAVKAPGDTGTSAEWNAEHVVDLNSKPKNNTTLIVAASDSLDTTRADYVCDGVDDEDEINAAIAALPASGGRISLLEGRFQIKTGIVVAVNNVAIVGCGKSTELDVQADTDGSDVITLSAVDGCLVEDVYIHGKGAVPAVDQRGILLDDGCSSCMIRDVWVDDMDHVGIHAGNVEDCTIEGCHATSCLDAGLGMTFGSGNLFIGNISSGNVGHGIQLWQASRNVFVGNTCNESSSGCGIWAQGASDRNSFKGNEASENAQHGIAVVGSDNNVVQGNICYRNERSGVITDDSHSNIINSNECQENDVNNTATWDGITIQNSSNYNVISSNRCEDNDRDEIRIDDAGSTKNLVHGNMCIGVDHVAAIVDNGTNTTSADNVTA